MKLNVVQLIKLGSKYQKLWPERAELANYFAEYRTIQTSRLVCRHMPAVALVTLVFQLYLGSYEILAQALTVFLLMLSMPVQALVMLGLQADKFLPPGLATWYKEGVAKFNQQGGSIKLSTQKPRYFDLAQLLNLSAQQSKF